MLEPRSTMYDPTEKNLIQPKFRYKCMVSDLDIRKTLDARRWCLLALCGAAFQPKLYPENLLLLGNWRWWAQKAAQTKQQYTNLFSGCILEEHVVCGREI
ncbi:unnamed protein product [Cylindrotheca closterium]|uniref:Uncharacterized protein n=1 Tax=Cylindrotheca closterium TaxID=2856 RepID=A0AAD2G7V3_9STRA|nr:unnamed protein product [Cylindrotheca closterium]